MSNYLSNEQRAHDLAIATLPMLKNDPSLLNALKDEEGEVHFDVFNIYKDIYEATLESFNRNFPND